MLPALSCILRWFSVWWRYCALLVVIFLLRAMFVLSVLPPFEGWDEYQHLAYAAYLAETGRTPRLGDGSEVPRSLYPDLVRYPHGELAMEQVGPIGARSYRSFWRQPTAPIVAPNACEIPLYQAQHAPLYYRLVAPVYKWFARPGGILATITVLRLVNVAFGAASLAIALAGIGCLVKAGPHRYLLSVLLALQPLYLLNCARVANDALAVLFGTAAIASLLVLLPRRFWLGILLGGGALGLAILTKASNLSLLPFALFVVAWRIRRGRLGVKRGLAGGAVLLAIVLAMSGHYFYANLTRFGVLTPMQEAVHNHQTGKTLTDVLHTAWAIHWWGEFASPQLRHSLWVGGWSWLPLPRRLERAQEIVAYLAVCGGLLAVSAARRRERRLFVEAGPASCLVVLLVCTAGGLAYHAVQTKMAYGSVLTNAWYAAVAFPWLLALYCQGLAYLPGRRTAGVLVIGTALLYLGAETYGTLAVMVPEYVQSPWGPTARDRLAQLHLPGLGPNLTLPSLAMVLLLVLVAIGAGLLPGAARGKEPSSREGQPPSCSES